MTEVMSSNGYGSFADPKNPNKEVSACLEQEANAREFNLFTKASLLSDPVAVDLDIIQSQGPGYYTMENMYGCGCELKDAREVQLSQPMINFEGGKGWIGEKGCLVDVDSKLRESDDRLTNKKYIHQLVERPHLTTGNYVKGYFDVDVESVIRPGIDAGDERACNSLSGVTIGNYFTPMIPKLQDEVQNTVHIIPEDSMQSWVRGGLPSRQMQRNKDYLRRCQEKTYESQN
tara:strand:+ start:9849 stop:10541 length:693 start_codon:yes stop_codon:yes gene_type:complete